MEQEIHRSQRIILAAISKVIVLDKKHKHEWRAKINYCWKVTFPLIVAIGLMKLSGVEKGDIMSSLGIDSDDEYDARLKDWYDIIAKADEYYPPSKVKHPNIRIYGHTYDFDFFRNWVDTMFHNLTWDFHTKTINGDRKVDYLHIAKNETITSLIGIEHTSWRKVGSEEEDRNIALFRKIAMILRTIKNIKEK